MRISVLSTLFMAVIVNGLQIDVVQQTSLETSQQGCDPLCHHLTTGPCQHPNLDDDTCMFYLEHSEDGIVTREDGTCPPGTIDCGWQPTLALNGTVIPPMFVSSSRTASKTPTSSISITSSVTATRSVTVSPTTTRTVTVSPTTTRTVTVSPTTTRTVTSSPTSSSQDQAIFAVSSSGLLTKRSIGFIDMPWGDYIIEVDFTFRHHNEAISNIFHITTGGNCCDLGFRIPAVWIYGRSTRYHFRTGLPQTGNHGFDPEANLSIGGRYNVKFIRDLGSDGRTVTDLVLQNGEEIGRHEATSTSDISSVVYRGAQVYMSDPWHDPAGIEVHSFKITTYVGQDNFWY